MKKINWLRVGVTGVVAVLILFAGGMLLSGWSYHGWGMMGPGRMMTDWGYSPLGWVRLIVTWMIPISLIILAFLGSFWLVSRPSTA